MQPTRAILVLALVGACRTEAPRTPPRLADSTGRVSTAPTDATLDGCRQTRGERPDTSIRILDTLATERWRRAFGRSGAEFTCTIHPSLVLRLVAHVDSAHPAVDSVVVLTAGDSARALQVLRREPGDAEAPMPYNTDVLTAIDLDADGWRDLLVGKFWGATGNTGYDVWRYHPASRRFVADTMLSDLWNPAPVQGRPCVRTSSNSSARDDGMGVYCLHAGRWVLDSVETNSWNRDSNTVTRRIMTRRGDSLATVRVETRPDE